MRLLSAFCAICLALLSAPRARAEGALIEVGRAIVWEKSSDGLSYDSQVPWTGRVGWGFYDLDALVEYATFSKVDGEAGGEIGVTERQASVWARKTFASSFFAKPYVGAGLGARWESVRTRFLDQEETSYGRPRWLGAISGGAMVPIGVGFVGELEARFTSSPGYAPNPQLSASALLGYRF